MTRIEDDPLYRAVYDTMMERRPTEEWDFSDQELQEMQQSIMIRYRRYSEQNPNRWPTQIFRISFDPKWEERPWHITHIPLKEADLSNPLGRVYKHWGRYYVNVKAKTEPWAMTIGKELIRQERKKENGEKE